MIAAVLLALALVWPVGTSSSVAESEVLADVQAIRPGPDLIRFGGLDRLADWRAADMGQRGYFSHTLPDGTHFWDYFRRYGVVGSRGSCEILAWNNYPTNMAAQEAWESWLDSPSHHECIVAAAYDAVGIGSYRAVDGHVVFAVIFSDQPERKPTVNVWMRASVWGRRLTVLPRGTRLVVFNHRRDSAGRTWFYVWANGRYGWVSGWNTRSAE